MPAKIVQGSDKTLTIQLIKRSSLDPVGEPIDISSPTALEVCFPGTTATVVKTLANGVTVTNGPAGKLTVELDETDTENLAVGFEQDIEVKLEKPAGNTQLIQILNAIDVVERLCP